jgi:hypothetical protein
MEGYSDYDEGFDPLTYTKKKYSEVTEWIAQPLRALHDIFLHSPTGLRVLEFGCGPVPVYMVSAPTKATEVVFADYTKSNREFLQMWLDKDPRSPDYTSFFRYAVVDLEGKGEDEVVKRQDDLRQITKCIIHCDATQDPPLSETGPYDVIYSSLCLTVTSKNIQDYSQAVGRLAKLLKSGGKLALNSVEARDGAPFLSYPVGKEMFYALSLSVDSLKSSMEENGFIDVNVTRRLIDDVPGAKSSMSTQVLAMLFVTGTKK